MKLWRCDNPKCQARDKGKFISDEGVCPQCKIDMDHPRFGNKIQRLAMIHFDPPSDFPGIGAGVRACDKEKSIAVQGGMASVMTAQGGVPNPYHGGTGNPLAVTCPNCMKSDDYKAAMALLQDEDAVKKVLEGTCGRLDQHKPVPVSV